MSSKVHLRATEGPIEDREWTFEEHDTFIFGRAADCHAKLADTDTTASRHHFLLEVNPPDVCIRDLGSRNGTRVNGKKTGGRAPDETAEEGRRRKFPEVDLVDGDSIEVGESVFLVSIASPRKAASGSPRCSQCDAELPAAASNRRGDPICRACVDGAGGDPMALLLRALQDAAEDGPASDAPIAAAFPAAEVAGYVIGPCLGRGSMGAVYAATRARDGEAVAIKVLLAKVAIDPDARAAFLREVEQLGDLSHPNIVRVIDRGAAGAAFYFVLERCDGGSLDDLVALHGGKLPLALAKPVVLQVLDGLAYAHGRGLVHRDVKPSNVLLTAAGVAKLSDFGLAKRFQQAGLSGMTVTGHSAGTLEYMPREQLTSFEHVKPASDVWSMGATIYKALTGVTPLDFAGGHDPMQVLLRGDMVPLCKRAPELPAALGKVLDRALARDAKDRHPTAGELRDALAAAL